MNPAEDKGRLDVNVDTPLIVEKVDRNIRDLDHHVTAPAKPTTSFLPWGNNNRDTSTSTTRFQNPWPSWYRPTRAEAWEHLQWGSDDDSTIHLATSRLSDDAPPRPPQAQLLPSFGDIINSWPDSNGAKATRLLSIDKPDFSFDISKDAKAKVTWLGHASSLVQLPPLDEGVDSRPIRLLFDPIFSMRCSPSQSAGPIRSYPAPCAIEDLPAIDAVLISHNHYDHLDLDTILGIWKQSRKTVQFFVPLGNQRWFVESGIPRERVTEMDWWDCAHLSSRTSSSSSADGNKERVSHNRELKIWCTPAQHNSGRLGVEANSTLWSSWYIEHPGRSNSAVAIPYRVFFAGDTGYQYHSSPKWPPSPTSTSQDIANANREDKALACPAFEEIRDRLGPPDLLLLPVWVGATFTYLRSFVPLPDWISPFPRHTGGVSGANHMPPWDAVRVFKLMTGEKDERLERAGEPYRPVAVAMHWGTFVTDPVEVFKTLGQLEWACISQGVNFARSLPEVGEDGEDLRDPCFLAVNHGQSAVI